MQIAVLYLLLTSCMIHIYAITSSSTSSSTGDHIIEFDDNSIQSTLELADFSFIYFYSDVCKYCRKFDPTFENLSVLYNQPKQKDTIKKTGSNNERLYFQILKTNARQNNRLSQLFKVSQYPTLKLLNYKTKEIITYDNKNNRDLQSIINYLQQNLNIEPQFENFKSKVKYYQSPPSDSFKQDLDFFGNENELEKNDKLIFFIASYLPEWSDYQYLAHFIHQLALDYPDLTIIIVDYEKLNDYGVLSKYEINSFPSVMYLKNNGDYKKYQFSSQSKRELDYHKIEKFLDSVDQDNGTWEKVKESLIDTETLSHQQQEVDYEDDDDLAFEHIEL